MREEIDERVAIMQKASEPMKALLALDEAGYLTPAQYHELFARIKADDPCRCEYCRDDCTSCGFNKGANG